MVTIAFQCPKAKDMLHPRVAWDTPACSSTNVQVNDRLSLIANQGDVDVGDILT
jgi:hypothetical protein